MATPSNSWLDDLAQSLTPEEQIEVEGFLLQDRFLHLVRDRMDELGMSRAQLATKLGTSPSYVTQLFRGNLFVNMKTLAKLQRVLGIRFEVADGNQHRNESLPIALQQPAKAPVKQLYYYTQQGDYKPTVYHSAPGHETVNLAS